MSQDLKSLHHLCWKINLLFSLALMKWTKLNCWLVEAFIVYQIMSQFKFQITWVIVWTKVSRTHMRRAIPMKKVLISFPTVLRIHLNSKQEIDNPTIRWVSAEKVPSHLIHTKSKIRCLFLKQWSLMKIPTNSPFPRICIAHLNPASSATVFKQPKRKLKIPSTFLKRWNISSTPNPNSLKLLP